VAEWLGRGLQSPVQRFESAPRLLFPLCRGFVYPERIHFAAPPSAPCRRRYPTCRGARRGQTWCECSRDPSPAKAFLAGLLASASGLRTCGGQRAGCGSGRRLLSGSARSAIAPASAASFPKRTFTGTAPGAWREPLRCPKRTTGLTRRGILKLHDPHAFPFQAGCRRV
jgi:hypothetical protein